MGIGNTLATLDRDQVRQVVAAVVRDHLAPTRPAPHPLVVNISVRHMHVTQQHLEVLFGPGAELTVDLVGPKRRMLHNVRILGPTRSHTQIELAFSDAIMLGIDVPVRMSGDIDGTPGCIVMGPRGHLLLEQGVIRAQRHVHMSPEDAAAYGVQAGDALGLEITHPRCSVTLADVIARVDPAFKLEVHIDSDEGNACDLPGATGVRLVKSGGCPCGSSCSPNTNL